MRLGGSQAWRPAALVAGPLPQVTSTRPAIILQEAACPPSSLWSLCLLTQTVTGSESLMLDLEG